MATEILEGILSEQSAQLLSEMEKKRKQYLSLKGELEHLDSRELEVKPAVKKSRHDSEPQNPESDDDDPEREEPDEEWLELYEELKRYKEEHGDTVVPAKWKKDTALSRWVRRQRALKKQQLLRPDRVALLNAIDFQWVLRPGTVQWAGLWDKRFEELKHYKEKYGDVNVPTRYKHNPTLAVWVRTQRSMRRRGILAPERIEKLNSIGFKW